MNPEVKVRYDTTLRLEANVPEPRQDEAQAMLNSLLQRLKLRAASKETMSINRLDVEREIALADLPFEVQWKLIDDGGGEIDKAELYPPRGN